MAIFERLFRRRSRTPPAEADSDGDIALHIEDRLLGARLHLRPFPYLIVDDVLTSACLDDVRRHWPDDSTFDAEVPGNYVCNPRQLKEDGTARPQFWRDFARDVAPVMARGCLGRFAEWVVARYGDDFHSIMVANFSLMRADPDYPGHPCHVHHWHDPLWIATLLLYVDPEAGGQQGTTINTFEIPTDADPLARATDFASRRFHGSKLYGSTWNAAEDTIEVRTAGYKPNRMVVFLDSPISYHSVKPLQTPATGRRRIIRMHLGAPWSLCSAMYGVPYEDYRPRREDPVANPVVQEWLKRDIAQVWETKPAMSAADRKAWAAQLTFDF